MEKLENNIIIDFFKKHWLTISLALIIIVYMTRDSVHKSIVQKQALDSLTNMFASHEKKMYDSISHVDKKYNAIPDKLDSIKNDNKIQDKAIQILKTKINNNVTKIENSNHDALLHYLDSVRSAKAGKVN